MKRAHISFLEALLLAFCLPTPGNTQNNPALPASPSESSPRIIFNAQQQSHGQNGFRPFVPSVVRDTTDYFPLDSGNTWWYITTVGPYVFVGDHHITGHTTIHDTLYTVKDSVTLYRKDKLGNVYQRLDDVDQLYFKLNAMVGDSWDINMDGLICTMSLYAVKNKCPSSFFGSLDCKWFQLKPVGGGTDNDVWYTLAAGIGMLAIDTSPISDQHAILRHAIIADGDFGALLHVTTIKPPDKAKDVERGTTITFRFNSVVDTGELRSHLTITAKKGGIVSGRLTQDPYQGSYNNPYIFTPDTPFPEGDTVSITLSGGLRDRFSLGLDGNNNDLYESSPNDDTTWTFSIGGTSDVAGGTDSEPNTLTLEQNHPNPFHDRTTIRFRTGAFQSPVSLKVFDVFGREVAALVDEVLTPGTHIVEFDARAAGVVLSSGLYTCRLSENNRTSIRTMVHIR